MRRITPLRIVTLLTVAVGGAAAALLLTSSSPNRAEHVLAVVVVLGVPLSGTLVGAGLSGTQAFIPAAVGVDLSAAAVTGFAIHVASTDGWTGTCEFAVQPCVHPLSAAVLGGVLVGAIPVALYVAGTRRLRNDPIALVGLYLILLPAFVVWAGGLAALADAVTSASAYAGD